jgi:hypothetical protein
VSLLNGSSTKGFLSINSKPPSDCATLNPSLSSRRGCGAVQSRFAGPLLLAAISNANSSEKPGPLPTRQRLRPWTIVTAFKIDGKHRYMWTRNQRSLVSRARAPQDDQLMSEHAFSASSLLFDLNDEASTARTKQSSPIIPPA